MSPGIDLPDGTKMMIQGHTGQSDPTLTPPWFDSKSESVLASGSSTYLNNIASLLYAYSLDKVCAISSAAVAVKLVIYYNGAIVAGAVGTGVATIDMSMIPNLQWCYGDQLKIIATNLDSSTRTIIISILGTQIYRPTSGSGAPVADFSGSPLLLALGQEIAFLDLSSRVPTSWLWSFGDGGGSPLQNPSKSYTVAGVYDILLRAVNADGFNIMNKAAYVEVLDPQDFSAGWVETDVTGKITQTTINKWTFTALPGNTANYCYSDKGAGFISEGRASCKVFVSACGAGCRVGLFGFGPTAADLTSFAAGRLWVEWTVVGGVQTLRLRFKSAGTDVSDTMVATLSQNYWVILDHPLGGDTAYAYVYSNEAMTTLLDTLVITDADLVAHTFRYLFGPSSANEAVATTSTGYVENMTLLNP